MRPGAAAFLGVDSGHVMHVAIHSRTVIGGDDFGQAGLGVEQVGGHSCAEGLRYALAHAVVLVTAAAEGQKPICSVPGVRVHAVGDQVAVGVIGVRVSVR